MMVMKLGVLSLTFQKHLIKSGTMVFRLQENGISGNLLKILKHFLTNRKQRVALNGQSSSWTNIGAGVPQGSILGPLLCSIYINDLADGLSFNTKLLLMILLFFSSIHNSIITTSELNSDCQNKTVGFSVENEF